MAKEIPPWIAELADSGSFHTEPSAGDRAKADKLGRLARAFRQLAPADNDTRNAAGGQLFQWGHLRASERLGSGSYGDVYRAFDTILERDVALKLRHGDSAHSRAFITEARRLARVRHPNVLGVHGAGVNDGRAGLWADLLAGKTVGDTVAENGPLPWPMLLAIARDLAGALAAVHAAGLVHGDVKPSNIMLDADGKAVLMDFGAASEHDSAGRFGVLGSPLFMAPEQLRGAAVNTAADLYSLGVTIYFAASGRHTIQAATLTGLQDAHAAFDADAAVKALPDLPRRFRDLLAAWLDAIPEKRPDAATSLRRIEHIATAPARRRKRIAVGAFVASLGIALLVSLFALERINAEREAAETARAQQTAVSQFLQDTLAAPNPRNAGANVQVAEVLDNAVHKAQDQFADQPAILLPLLQTIGKSYRSLGLLQQAEPLLAQALAISRERYGRDSEAGLQVEFDLVDSRIALQPHDRARRDAMQALLDRARRALGPDHRISVAAALTLGHWDSRHDTDDAARRMLSHVLAQRPPTHPEVIQRSTALLYLAEIERIAGDYPNARTHLEEALAIAERIGSPVNTQSARSQLAIVYSRIGKPDLAEPQFRALLADSERFGESHDSVRSLLLALGGVLNEQHKYAEAEPVLRRAVELARRYAGKDDIALYKARSNLGNALAGMGRLDEASTIRSSLLADARDDLGKNHEFVIATTANLAEQRILEGNGKAAEPLATEAVRAANERFGAKHLYTLESRELLARAHFAEGQDDKAIAEMATICEAKRVALGPDHEYSLRCLTNRADMLAANGDREAAIALLEKVLEGRSRAFGADHASTIQTMQRINDLRPGD